MAQGSPKVRPRRGRGEGSIPKQRPDGRWEGKLDLGYVGGKRRRKSVYGRTRTEVASKLRKLATGLEEGQPPGDDRTTVAWWLRHWSDTILVRRLANGTLADKTANGYADIVRLHLIPELGHLKLAKLAPEHVDSLISTKQQAGYSPNTCRLIRTTLRRALNDARRSGKVTRNVAELSEPVAVGRRASTWLTPEEARILLGAVRGHRLEALYLVILGLGLRRGEALALAWSDVDLDARTLRVGASLARQRTRDGGTAATHLVISRPKTASSWRTQALTDPVVEALREHRKRQAAERLAVGPAWDDHGLVFTTELGHTLDPDNFSRAFTRIAQEAGLGKRHPHELRHSAATFALAQGVPLHVVSSTLGHSSIAVTKDVYGHLVEEQRREAAEAVSRVLWGSSPNPEPTRRPSPGL